MYITQFSLDLDLRRYWQNIIVQPPQAHTRKKYDNSERD